jgi:hypothetical protein
MELLRQARLSREPSRNSGLVAARGERQGSAVRTAGDWDPVALEVHKAIGGNPLPAFVRRPHDDLLDATLDPDARASRLIVLRGGPSTGKSRSAYHAVCKGRLAAWRLEYPPIPAELGRLMEEGVPPRTVIWLKELRDYADAEGGQEVLARLVRFLAGTAASSRSPPGRGSGTPTAAITGEARVPVTPTLRCARCWQDCQRWLA